jgi:hypothetical protein
LTYASEKPIQLREITIPIVIFFDIMPGILPKIAVPDGMHRSIRKADRIILDQEFYAGGHIERPSGLTRCDNGFLHCHRLEDLVLNAARNSQWRYDGGSMLNVRPYIRNVSGHGETRFTGVTP